MPYNIKSRRFANLLKPVFHAYTFMMNIIRLSLTVLTLLMLAVPAVYAQKPTSETTRPVDVPPVVHSQVGDSSVGVAELLKLINIGKRQQYSAALKDSYDTDIFSPKSVTFSKDGRLFYVNSLEGCKTVVYDTRTLEKKHVIEYSFPSGSGSLWGEPSGYYPFSHYSDGQERSFKGKPVESTWSHGGRYLWVPFYRRTFDINAQDPSAVAVIDTRTHTIVRMLEAGPLPKMIATSPDGRIIAVTHWGDNTIGFIDISSDNPVDWHHLSPVTVGNKLKLDYPLDKSVDRDAKSGFLLRGTVFTPDGRYLLVSAMAGPMAVIDVASRRYLGMVQSVYGVRHLAISGEDVFGSCNIAGTVMKFSLDSLIAGVERAEKAGSGNIKFGGGTKTCKVGSGARTLDVSPDGKYVFVACNSGNAVYVVDAETMKVADYIRADSYPVGLAMSKDGRYLAVTSQGREGYGGNALNIYSVRRPDIPTPVEYESRTEEDDATEGVEPATTEIKDSENAKGIDRDTLALIIAIVAGLLAAGALMLFYPHNDKDNN